MCYLPTDFVAGPFVCTGYPGRQPLTEEHMQFYTENLNNYVGIGNANLILYMISMSPTKEPFPLSIANELRDLSAMPLEVIQAIAMREIGPLYRYCVQLRDLNLRFSYLCPRDHDDMIAISQNTSPLSSTTDTSTSVPFV